jgi:hypothetical protein
MGPHECSEYQTDQSSPEQSCDRITAAAETPPPPEEWQQNRGDTPGALHAPIAIQKTEKLGPKERKPLFLGTSMTKMCSPCLQSWESNPGYEIQSLV